MPHFEHLIKKHGALLAKGRLLGVQFDTLFTDNLYLEISKNAIDTAEVLKKALKEKGIENDPVRCPECRKARKAQKMNRDKKY